MWNYLLFYPEKKINVLQAIKFDWDWISYLELLSIEEIKEL